MRVLKRRRGRKNQRGIALFVALILIAVLTAATIALASLATSDTEIAAADRRGTLSFAAAENGIDEVLSDSRLALPPGPPTFGFAPDPGDLTLISTYTPITQPPEARYSANVKFVRDGPVEESSALEVKSIVYSISVNGFYQAGGGTGDVLARQPVNAEVYRIAPKTLGVVTRARHYE